MGTKNKSSKFDSIVIESQSVGQTYSRNKPSVYGYGTYEKSSVLAGQQRRCWLGEYETIEEARAAYPEAEVVDGTGFFSSNNERDVRPMWCTPEYEAETGECWSDD